jgi:hypothetical protein
VHYIDKSVETTSHFVTNIWNARISTQNAEIFNIESEGSRSFHGTFKELKHLHENLYFKTFRLYHLFYVRIFKQSFKEVCRLNYLYSMVTYFLFLHCIVRLVCIDSSVAVIG